ncbi:FAD-binding oxidoreductase [Sesbania bispinosa]|nr:FAD-binding oxidoreductase [Sesbania bispinosa]
MNKPQTKTATQLLEEFLDVGSVGDAIVGEGDNWDRREEAGERAATTPPLVHCRGSSPLFYNMCRCRKPEVSICTIATCHHLHRPPLSTIAPWPPCNKPTRI